MHVRYLRMSHVADRCENDRKVLMVVGLSKMNYACGVSYAFFVRSRLHKMDAFGQEHRIHNFVSCHGDDVRNTPNRKQHYIYIPTRYTMLQH